MAEKVKFKVLRQHYADREYRVGDERELIAADAKHLVDLGTLQKAKETNVDDSKTRENDAKQAEQPKNKKAQEPSNKAAPDAEAK